MAAGLNDTCERPILFVKLQINPCAFQVQCPNWLGRLGTFWSCKHEFSKVKCFYLNPKVFLPSPLSICTQKANLEILNISLTITPNPTPIYSVSNSPATAIHRPSPTTTGDAVVSQRGQRVGKTEKGGWGRATMVRKLRHSRDNVDGRLIWGRVSVERHVEL